MATPPKPALSPEEIERRLSEMSSPDPGDGQLPPALMQGRRPVPAANAADQLKALQQISQSEFPTLGEKVEAVGQGTRMGLREGAPISAGGMLGLAAGSLALAGVFAILALLNTPIRELATLYGSVFQLEPLNVTTSALLLVTSMMLGVIGAMLSVRRALRESD